MKKLICLFLAAVMMLSLTSCFFMNDEDEDTQEDFDAAISEAEDIFDDASDKMVRYKTRLAEEDGEEYYRVKATFNEDKFTSVSEMKAYADEIINGPVAKAEKVLKPVELLLPLYKNTLVYNAISEPEQQSEIVDIIFSSVRFEKADVFALTKTVETVDAMCSNPSRVASTYNLNLKKVNSELNDFSAAVLSLE